MRDIIQYFIILPSTAALIHTLMQYNVLLTISLFIMVFNTIIVQENKKEPQVIKVLLTQYQKETMQ